MKTPLVLLALATLAMPALRAANDTDTAATAINTLGIDLLAKTGKPSENALLSPYSIQEALAMTYAGAAGKTRDEMAATLHFPKDAALLNKSFAALDKELADIEAGSRQTVAYSKERGGPSEPVTLSVANRLYGQKGYAFRDSYLDAVKKYFGAPFAPVDFTRDAENARKEINGWVAEQTHKRIEDLIPKGGLDKDSRLVLVNAIYLKAAWQDEFNAQFTKPAPFHVKGGDAADVPAMNARRQYGYAKRDDYTVVTLPYVDAGLQFTVLLPDGTNGLAALEAKLTPALLAGCADLKTERVDLSLPKFKIEPPLMALSDQLKALGVKTAFDEPRGSADFDGIAPRKPDDYLYISEVFHKTFLALDEHGTEAAAATAVVMMVGSAAHPQPPKVYQVHVDHPFLFAIQDCKTGACLFLGRVTDPRDPR